MIASWADARIDLTQLSTRKGADAGTKHARYFHCFEGTAGNGTRQQVGYFWNCCRTCAVFPVLGERVWILERPVCRHSWALTAGLAGVALAQIGVQYRLNYWNRDFFNALEGRDAAGLWAQALVFVPLAFLSISLSVLPYGAA